MPYALEHVKDGYYVINKNTGRRFSKKPLSHNIAKRQLIALRIHAPDGGHLIDIYDDEMHAGNFLNQFKFSNLPNTILTLPKRIYGTIFGRNDFPPKVRDILEKYGNEKIIGMTIYRDPIQGTLDQVANLVSLGKFNEVKDKYGYDYFYHLYMVVNLESGVKILIEKNSVINMDVNPSIKSSADNFIMKVPSNFNTTLDQLMQRTKQSMGDKFYPYDPFNNNCQIFLMSIINSNPSLIQENPNARNFILQDVSGLEKDLHPLSKNIFRGVTNLGSRFNVLTEGYGFMN